MRYVIQHSCIGWHVIDKAKDEAVLYAAEEVPGAEALIKSQAVFLNELPTVLAAEIARH